MACFSRCESLLFPLGRGAKRADGRKKNRMGKKKPKEPNGPRKTKEQQRVHCACTFAICLSWLPFQGLRLDVRKILVQNHRFEMYDQCMFWGGGTHLSSLGSCTVIAHSLFTLVWLFGAVGCWLFWLGFCDGMNLIFFSHPHCRLQFSVARWEVNKHGCQLLPGSGILFLRAFWFDFWFVSSNHSDICATKDWVRVGDGWPYVSINSLINLFSHLETLENNQEHSVGVFDVSWVSSYHLEPRHKPLQTAAWLKWGVVVGAQTVVGDGSDAHVKTADLRNYL